MKKMLYYLWLFSSGLATTRAQAAVPNMNVYPYAANAGAIQYNPTTNTVSSGSGTVFHAPTPVNYAASSQQQSAMASQYQQSGGPGVQRPPTTATAYYSGTQGTQGTQAMQATQGTVPYQNVQPPVVTNCAGCNCPTPTPPYNNQIYIPPQTPGSGGSSIFGPYYRM
jgi:hypothetical protein